MTARYRVAYLLFAVAAVGMQTIARTIVLPPQPVSPYADTEVS